MKRSYLIILIVCAAAFVAAAIGALTRGGPDPSAGPAPAQAAVEATDRATDRDAPATRTDATRPRLSDVNRAATPPSPSAGAPRQASETRASASDARPGPPGLDEIRARVRSAQQSVPDAAVTATPSSPSVESPAEPAPSRVRAVSPPVEPAASAPVAVTPPPDADPVVDAVAEEVPEASPALEPDAGLQTTRARSEPEPQAQARVATRARDPQPAAEPPTPQTYTIRSGDTLESIAIDLYGEGRYWADIAEANPLVDPIRLRIGQVIRLPADVTDADDDPDRVIAPGEEVRYTIRPGDTLSDIAQQYYGQASRWRFLYNVNRETIGPNPNTLQAGDVLIIRPYPEPAR